MADKWVSKIEATTCFKVTERTLDNWVKAGKISKARKNGQIMYEINAALEEKQAEEGFEGFNQSNFSQQPEDKGSYDTPEEEETGPSEQELKLEVRLEEKMNQIQSLMETLNRWEKDKNTLILERGSLAEKTNLLTLEAESLRKEKEMLQKDYRNISERSFSKFGVFIFIFTVVVLLGCIGSVLFWKYSEKEKELKEDLQNLSVKLKDESIAGEKKVAEIEEKLSNKNERLISDILKTKEEWKLVYEELMSEKMKLSAELQKNSEASRKVSEQDERISELRKDAETLQKALERLQIENNQYNLQLKVIEATHETKGKESGREKEKDLGLRFLKNAEE